MTDLPEPNLPTGFGRFLVEVLTMKLLRRDDRPHCWRLFIMLGVFLACTIGCLSAGTGKMGYGDVLLAMACTLGQFACSAMIYDTAMRREELSKWRQQELRKVTDEHRDRAIKEVTEFRLRMVEAIGARAAQIQGQLDKHAREVHGEGWKGDKGTNHGPDWSEA